HWAPSQRAPSPHTDHSQVLGVWQERDGQLEAQRTEHCCDCKHCGGQREIRFHLPCLAMGKSVAIMDLLCAFSVCLKGYDGPSLRTVSRFHLECNYVCEGSHEDEQRRRVLTAVRDLPS
ncbi:uncharacterized, partial [Tachysurus ichikawai]